MNKNTEEQDFKLCDYPDVSILDVLPIGDYPDLAQEEYCKYCGTKKVINFLCTECGRI